MFNHSKPTQLHAVNSLPPALRVEDPSASPSGSSWLAGAGSKGNKTYLSQLLTITGARSTNTLLSCPSRGRLQPSQIIFLKCLSIKVAVSAGAGSFCALHSQAESGGAVHI